MTKQTIYLQRSTGPWQVSGPSGDYWGETDPITIYDANGLPIATTFATQARPDPHERGNALQIAAAPGLLAAAVNAFDWLMTEAMLSGDSAGNKGARAALQEWIIKAAPELEPRFQPINFPARLHLWRVELHDDETYEHYYFVVTADTQKAAKAAVLNILEPAQLGPLERFSQIVTTDLGSLDGLSKPVIITNYQA